ncbi:low affinity NH4+ transporter [Penicillium mononematosum]|uniref:low affinity NH4+ transporter n=1 Tax=Penicillium mononematosum TaxID=268346 RepID=UPI0025495B18|nr:low affinity NH4+ transporter [Penicillium mononematosum]KAJ6178646.1 low affinity NH4+ transporter [Penicillium mononematosum]
MSSEQPSQALPSEPGARSEDREDRQTFVGIIALPWDMNSSFPAATIILSRAMPRQHQGLAASLVTTFVNYSISIGLGFAGTVESQVNGQGRMSCRATEGRFAWVLGSPG